MLCTAAYVLAEVKTVKQKHQIRSRRKTSCSPSPAAWCMLVICWIFVVPLSFFVLRSAKARHVDPVPVMRQTVELPKTEKLPFYASYEKVRDVYSLRGDEPTILIYHTHTTEAYFKSSEDEYVSSSLWRTRDAKHSVVAVGEELKSILESLYGFNVIHDVTDHEPPKLATAYDRSLETMSNYKRKYPSIVLFIDLHRDAYSETDKPCDFATINGEECARLMLVVGKGEQYDEKPYFDVNLSIAEKITNHLNTIEPSLARKIRIKSGRYNQHVSPNCILVEVGHNANTLEQAKNSMRYLAESIALSFSSNGIPSGDWAPN